MDLTTLDVNSTRPPCNTHCQQPESEQQETNTDYDIIEIKTIDSDLKTLSGKKEDGSVLTLKAQLKFMRSIFVKPGFKRITSLLTLTFSNILQFGFYSLREIVSLFFIGHFSDSTTLAAVGLANMWVNMSIYVIICAIQSVLDTRCAQENGKRNFKEVGMTFHKGLVLAWIAALAMCIVNFMSEDILIFLKQDPAVANKMASGILPYSLFGFTCAFEACYSAFLQAQKITKPQNVATVTSFIIHPFLCYVCIGYFDMGVLGAGLTNLISNLITCACLLFFTDKKELGPGSLFFLKKESFKIDRDLIKNSIVNSMLIGLEWSAVEIGTFMAGLLGNIPLAAQVSVYQLEILFDAIPSSISYSMRTLVANYAGENNKKEFKSTIRTAIKMGIFVVSMFIMQVIPWQSQISELISSDKQVSSVVYDLLPYILCYFFFESLQKFCAGILKSLEKYKPAVNIVLFNSYIIGLPCAYFFGFVQGKGLIGLWMGYTVGAVTTVMCYVLYLTKLDFNTEIDKIQASNKEMEKTQVSNNETTQEACIGLPDANLP